MNKPVFKNQTLWTNDNLFIMRGLPDECIDLIYLDPPFNSNRNYEAPIGSEASGAAFKDTWTLSDCDNAWHGEIAEKEPAVYQIISSSELSHSKSIKSYLIMMAVRLLEMRRILKNTGSIYLHIDPNTSHYLKLLMDSVFGKVNFRNEIVWCYRGGGVPRKDFAKKHDIIFRYSKTKEYVFNVDDVRIPYSSSVSESNPSRYNKSYRANKVYSGYSPNTKGKHPEDWWSIQPLMPSDKKERTGYPTQKPRALLERIIKASSNEGDMILDPFCGCATTLIAAERLNRRWIGIDLSEKAVFLVKERMKKESDLFDDFQPIHRTDIPKSSADSSYRDPYKKKELYGRQEGTCNGCKILFPYRNMTVDHIVPQIHGGGDYIGNLQLLCGACNSTKGSGSQENLIVILKENNII